MNMFLLNRILGNLKVRCMIMFKLLNKGIRDFRKELIRVN